MHFREGSFSVIRNGSRHKRETTGEQQATSGEASDYGDALIRDGLIPHRPSGKQQQQSSKE